MAKAQHESNGYFSDWSPAVEEGRPTLEQYNKVCKEVKELKLRLKNEGKNRSESHGKHKFRHSEEQSRVQGRDQPIEGKERLIPSCTNCGNVQARPATPSAAAGRRVVQGGGAYQEDQPAPATKKLRSQLNPTNIKAQTAAITAMQSGPARGLWTNLGRLPLRVFSIGKYAFQKKPCSRSVMDPDWRLAS